MHCLWIDSAPGVILLQHIQKLQSNIVWQYVPFAKTHAPNCVVALKRLGRPEGETTPPTLKFKVLELGAHTYTTLHGLLSG